MIPSEEFFQLLKKHIEEDLPGEQAHLPMSPLNRPLSSKALQNSADYRRSSVAVVIHFTDSSSSLILIQRPDYEGAHSGQISFPGGKMDELDESAEFTARRECLEEIGVELSSELLIGKLTDVFIPVSKFLVHPYLYIYRSEMNIIPDEREVLEVLSYPLNELLREDATTTFDVRVTNEFTMKNVPCFLFGEKKIWGATALILNELREVLKSIL